MSDYYVLDEKNQPKPATSDEFGRFMRDNAIRKVVGRTELADGVQVSTVFLGLDHAWGGGRPLLFETLIFDGQYDGHMWRYSTRDEAIVGHLAVLDAIRAGLDPSETVSDAG